MLHFKHMETELVDKRWSGPCTRPTAG